jgi:hypothetical protein
MVSALQIAIESFAVVLHSLLGDDAPSTWTEENSPAMTKAFSSPEDKDLQLGLTLPKPELSFKSLPI